MLATLNHDATITYNSRTFDVRRLGLPTDTEIALPVLSGGVARGRILLVAATRVVRPSADQLRVAVALSDQVGAGLTAASQHGRGETASLPRSTDPRCDACREAGGVIPFRTRR